MPAGIKEKMSVDARTGDVHIPVVHRVEPGHPRGAFHYRENRLEPRPGMHMQMNEGKEHVWILFALPPGFLGKPKKYSLSMRFQTNQQQDDPLQLEIRQGNKQSPVVDTIQIPIPNTENKWITMEPIELHTKLGGDQKTLLMFTHPKPIGKGIWIRDFTLLPGGNHQHDRGVCSDYSIEWFSNWHETLYKKVKESMLPQLDKSHKEAFQAQCKIAQQAHQNWQKVINKEGPVRNKAELEYFESLNECEKVAMPLLEGSIDSTLQSIDFTSQAGKELLQLIAIAHGKPCDLGSYTAEGPEQKKRLQNLLQGDNDLLYQMLVHGGPRGGDYGQALDIYAEIQAKRQHGKSILPKLALAVALEFAQPHHVFHQPTVLIDPLERYLHYEEAYLNGELEPFFENLSVWELRMVVDCDGSHEQITWFRNMIWTYHPKIAAMGDYHWYVQGLKSLQSTRNAHPFFSPQAICVDCSDRCLLPSPHVEENTTRLCSDSQWWRHVRSKGMDGTICLQGIRKSHMGCPTGKTIQRVIAFVVSGGWARFLTFLCTLKSFVVYGSLAMQQCRDGLPLDG